MTIKKSQSRAWQLAKRYTARKHTNSVAVQINPDGTVLFESIVRGNRWSLSEKEIEELLLVKSKGNPT